MQRPIRPRPPPLPAQSFLWRKAKWWLWISLVGLPVAAVTIWFIYVTFWLHGPLGESARTFVIDLNAGNANAAVRVCTADFPPDRLDELSGTLSNLGPVRRVSAGYVWRMPGQHHARYVYGLCGTVYYSSGYRNYYIGFVREGGSFKVLEFDLDPSWVQGPVP